MGTVTRPAKLGGDPGGNVIAGNDVLASEWNGDINAIITQVNGSIDSINIATNGVGSTELASHASDNAQRAVGSDHIKDGAVTTLKIPDANVTPPKLPNATSAAGLSTAGIGTDKLRIIISTRSFTITFGTGILTIGAITIRLNDSGANWAASISAVCQTSGVVGASVDVPAANPTTNFPVADYNCLGAYVKNVSTGGGSVNLTGTMVFIFLHQDSA